MNKKKNILLKRCPACRKSGSEEDLIICYKCGDGFHKKCVNNKIEKFKCDRCKGEIKTDLMETYKLIKIYSRINKEGQICETHLKIVKCKF